MWKGLNKNSSCLGYTNIDFEKSAKALSLSNTSGCECPKNVHLAFVIIRPCEHVRWTRKIQKAPQGDQNGRWRNREVFTLNRSLVCAKKIDFTSRKKYFFSSGRCSNDWSTGGRQRIIVRLKNKVYVDEAILAPRL